jgi:hypothetical protein
LSVAENRKGPQSPGKRGKHKQGTKSTIAYDAVFAFTLGHLTLREQESAGNRAEQIDSLIMAINSVDVA